MSGQQISSSSQARHVDSQNEQLEVTQLTVEELLSRADSLADEFQQGAEARYIEEAIALDREALAICTPGHPQRADCLTILSGHLWCRCVQLGAVEDIEEAIRLGREALELRPPGDKDRFTSLRYLALHLSQRHQPFGRPEDLSGAIDLNKEVLLHCPPGDPNRSYVFSSLANCLPDRYNQLGGVDDLTEAIDLAREHLKLRPLGHSGRSISLNNLAIHLTDRYLLSGGPEDLSQAIDHNREALKLCPERHPARSMYLNNLATGISLRYQKLHLVEDLGEAIDLHREALKLRPPGHPCRSSCLNNLASGLCNRYRELGGVQDLDEAIDFYGEALRLHPPGHPLWSLFLENLTICLSDRYDQFHKQDDKEELFFLYASLGQEAQAALSQDHLSVARAWIDKAEVFHHPTTILAYQTALRVLVRYVTALPSLPQHLSILREQSSSLAADAFSAFLRNQYVTGAAEVLEQGRTLSWNQLARLRSPLDDVIASGPEGRLLANDYAHLTSLIRDVLNSPAQDQHDRAWRLNVKLENTVSKIRMLPGLSRFLLPSVFPDLQQAASHGPIIIVNASKFSCDALIIYTANDPIYIPLSVTKEDIRGLASDLAGLLQVAKREDVTKALRIFLRKLWDLVVSRIVDTLCAMYPPHSRIWWCPTSDFSLLPLHAAAPYRDGQKGFSDLYISSYTPTLNALIRARRPIPSGYTSVRKRFIAIGQADAAGTSKLHTIGTELANVRQKMDGLTVFTSVEGQDSCISRVMEELNRNAWVHVACHGLPNRHHPFESAFALHDGRLTIQHIMQCDLQYAEFAYLSACHTTVGDEESPDEALHLAAAMQFAGFRSVIGTMWAVDDAQTSGITSTFYKHMVDDAGRLDHTRAAYALWKTTRSAKVSLDQRILYVHIGA